MPMFGLMEMILKDVVKLQVKRPNLFLLINLINNMSK